MSEVTVDDAELGVERRLGERAALADARVQGGGVERAAVDTPVELLDALGAGQVHAHRVDRYVVGAQLGRRPVERVVLGGDGQVEPVGRER